MFLSKIFRRNKTKDHSKTVSKYLKGLRGIEIGGAAHNDFGLDALNIDLKDNTKPQDTYYQEQIRCGATKPKKVDIIASGDNLPFTDNSVDFVFSSHVLEHFFDPIKAIKEWLRVTKQGGYVVIIVPHKDRTTEKDKPRTTLQELIDRHEGRIINHHIGDNHFSCWITEDIIELCNYMKLNIIEYLDTDDAVGNGFLVVIRKD